MSRCFTGWWTAPRGSALPAAGGSLLPYGVEAGSLRLVTVDPLGGRDAAEWLNGGTLDPQALASVRMTSAAVPIPTS